MSRKRFTEYHAHGDARGMTMARGRVRTDRKLIDWAKLCNAGVKGQIHGVGPAPAAPVLPAEAKWMKMF